jgi:hypothetical protein
MVQNVAQASGVCPSDNVAAFGRKPPIPWLIKKITGGLPTAAPD